MFEFQVAEVLLHILMAPDGLMFVIFMVQVQSQDVTWTCRVVGASWVLLCLFMCFFRGDPGCVSFGGPFGICWSESWPMDVSLCQAQLL